MAKNASQNELDALLELLREIRAQADLRQVDLAEKLGQPQPFISRYESGERRLDILELRQLCKAVGITPAEFFDRLQRKIDET